MDNEKNNKHSKRLRHAWSLARDLVHRVSGSRHIAMIYSGNKLLAIGFNQDRQHPRQNRFLRTDEERQNIKLHAEVDAINKVISGFGPEILKDATIYVARAKFPDGVTHKRGRKPFLVGDSKPCESCSRAIKHFGIKNVFWTEERKEGNHQE